MKSFFIKNIFLLEIRKTEKNNKHIFDKSIRNIFLDVGIFFLIKNYYLVLLGYSNFYLLLKMLSVIIKHLKERNIPYYWDKDYNLLSPFQNTQIDAMHKYFYNLKSKILKEEKRKEYTTIEKSVRHFL